MANQRDYGEVLGVARDTSSKAIKDAFRELALKHHPDRYKEPDAALRLKGKGPPAFGGAQAACATPPAPACQRPRAR